MKKSVKISHLLLFSVLLLSSIAYGDEEAAIPIPTRIRQLQIRSSMLRAMEAESDPALAIKLLTKVLALDPNNDFALITIGKQSRQLDKQAQRDLALELAKLSERTPSAFPLLLHTLELAQEAQLPGKLIDRLLAGGLQAQLQEKNRSPLLEPFFINLFGEYALRQSALGQFDPAAAMFREMLAKYPNHPMLYGRALIFFNRAAKSPKPTEQDAETLRQLLQHFEQQSVHADDNGIIDLAELYYEAGLTDLALSLLDKKLDKTAPTGPFLQEKLRILGLTGQYQAAIDAAQPLLAQKPVPDYLMANLGFWYYQIGNYAEAAKYLQERLDQNSDQFSSTRYLLIHSLLKLKKWPQAQAEIDRIPDKEALNKLFLQADLYKKTGHPKKALIALDNFTESHPELLADENNERLFFLAYLDAAQKCRNQKAIWQVYEVLQENGKLADPDLANALGYLFADFNFALGEAEVLLKSALEHSPLHPAVLDSVAWLNFRQGKLAEAQEKIDRALSQPHRQEIESYAELFDHAGDIYLALGKDDQALGFYEKALKEPESDNFNPDKVRKKIEKLQQKSK